MIFKTLNDTELRARIEEFKTEFRDDWQKKEAATLINQLSRRKLFPKMKKKKQIKTRVLWTRHPAQKPHSTKKGKKGYSRKNWRREYASI